MKIQEYYFQGNMVGYSFICPGCGMEHDVRTKHPSGNNWTFNGDINKPTFYPSLKVSGTEPCTDEEVSRLLKGEKIKPRPFVCHSYIRDGRIQFLKDSTHRLKGQTIELQEI